MILPPAKLTGDEKTKDGQPAAQVIAEPAPKLDAKKSAELVTEAATPEIKTTAPIGTRKTSSGFSITAALKKSEEKPEENVQVETKVLPSSHWSETDLHKEWQLFLRKLQQEEVLVFNAISSFQLNKKGEDTVEVTYPSESARTEFDKVRAEFFNHFMHKVNHFNIKTEYKLDVTMKREVMTKRKIFDKFVEINPVLKELDEYFKLDFN